MRRSIVAILVVLIVIVVDQLIKIDIKTTFTLCENHAILGDWFHLVVIENRGMAFGMHFIGTMFLALFRVAAIIFFSYALCRLVKNKCPYGLVVCMSMIIAGAMGNIIDNMFYGLIFTESTYYETAHMVALGQGYGSFLSGKVVDMFYFPLFEWPKWMPIVGGDTFFGAIFNFADASISCGAVALIIFYHKYISKLEMLFKK